VNPKTVPCPACQAPGGEPCTAPTDTGRRPVNWFHLAREDEVREQELNP
jgi:hypothetical protein